MSFFNKKKPEIKFICLGVKYLEDGISQEDLDSCFEIFAKVFSKKIYTNEEIEEITKKLGFNIRDYYVFVDQTIKLGKWQMISKYRWAGSKKISEEELEQEFEKNISKELHYSRVEIENLSKKIGCSVWDRTQFDLYLIQRYLSKDDEILYQCILEPKKE
jgi:uncharacterized protein (DUF2344 family)